MLLFKRAYGVQQLSLVGRYLTGELIEHHKALFQAAASDDELPDEIHEPFQTIPPETNGRFPGVCSGSTNAFASFENPRLGRCRRSGSFDDGGSGDPCRPPLSQFDERTLEICTARIESLRIPA